MVAHLITAALHGLLDLCCTLALEGCPAVEHLIEKYPQGPHIHAVIILSPEEHFRCHILIRPTESRPL